MEITPSNIAQSLINIGIQLDQIDQTIDLQPNSPEIWKEVSSLLELSTVSSIHSWILPIIKTKAPNTMNMFEGLTNHFSSEPMSIDTSAMGMLLTTEPETAPSLTIPALTAIDTNFGLYLSTEPESAPELPIPSLATAMAPFPNSHFNFHQDFLVAAQVPWADRLQLISPVERAPPQPLSPSLRSRIIIEPPSRNNSNTFDPAPFEGVGFTIPREPEDCPSPASSLSPSMVDAPSLVSDSSRPSSRARNRSPGPEDPLASGHQVGNQRSRYRHHRSASNSSTIRPEPYPTVILNSDDEEEFNYPGNTLRRHSSTRIAHEREMEDMQFEAELRNVSVDLVKAEREKELERDTRPRDVGHKRSRSSASSNTGTFNSPMMGLQQLQHLNLDTPSLFPIVTQFSPPAPVLSPSPPNKSLRASSPVPTPTTTILSPPNQSSALLRKARTLQIDHSIVYVPNPSHHFMMHYPLTPGKPQINPKDTVELYLVGDFSINGGGALWGVVFSDLMGTRHENGNLVEYTTSMKKHDEHNNQVYLFESSTDGLNPGEAQYYQVQFFSPTHGANTVESLDSPSIIPLSSAQFIPPHLPRERPSQIGAPRTFIHLPPNSFISEPTHPIGSKEWWKLPICQGKHLKGGLPGGEWSGRYDVGEGRRPSRLIEHYAECSVRKDRFGTTEDGLGRLARAYQRAKNGK